MGNGMYAGAETKGYDKRRQKQQRPKRGNFAEVVVPNTGEKQRSECDRQENQGKRQTPKQAGGRAVKNRMPLPGRRQAAVKTRGSA